jgi:hypothetical protein
MRQKIYLGYLAVQIVVIIAVSLIFRVISDRQIAATLAGCLFVVVPPVLMLFQFRRSKFSEILWFFGVLQFWLLFALPILGLRLLNWGEPFAQLSLLGISGPILHAWSSKSYMVMMVMTVRSWILSGSSTSKA